MSPKALKIWLGVTLLVSLAAAPFLARGDQAERRIMQQNAQRISLMSDSQRNRLLQNEIQYQAATAQSKAAIQGLHSALEKDRISAGGELTDVMNQYEAWIKTLKLTQRQQLASTPNPQERIALIKEILQSQQERTARRGMPFFGGNGDRPHVNFPPMLNEKSLHHVMEALEDAAEDRLSEDQKDELDQLQGIKKDFKLLRILKEIGTGVTPKSLLEEPPHEFQEVAEKIDEFVDDERICRFIKDRSDSETAPGDRPFPPETRLVALVSQALMVELSKLRRTAHLQIDRSKLEAFLNTLPLDRQYELLSLEASDFQDELRSLYLDKEGLNHLPSRQEFRELFGRGPRGGPDRGPPGFRDFRDNRPGRGPSVGGQSSGRRSPNGPLSERSVPDN